MTWLLAADDASEEELQELAAEQRLLAYGQRMAVHAGLAGCLPGAGPERPLDFAGLRRLYARVYVFLTALRPC